MSKLINSIKAAASRISYAVLRFPFTVICLLVTASLVCYAISLHKDPDIIIQKLIFTLLLGSILGAATQLVVERLEISAFRRLSAYLVSIILTVGYYLIIMPVPEISAQVIVRTWVAIFAVFCLFVWIPSYKSQVDFNGVALINLKSAFTSILYAAVLSGGCAAIIASIDILLFNVSNDAYGYMMTIIWIIFATIYYLALLPRFNSRSPFELEHFDKSLSYPRFLEILVSYIAISLVFVYTLVLAAYFVKILITLKWPSGQLGAMVLAYSAAGLLIYILSSRLDNKFTLLYRRIFPKVLIPVVIMQLISVGIRLNAYGVTESRYYVVMFGVFSIVCGIYLSFKPVSRNGIIAILAAVFAIVSVIPPVDTFTVSRISQIKRLEAMLQAEKILVNGKIIARPDVSTHLRVETTNILNYLKNQRYMEYIEWLPDDFNPYTDMPKTLGFEPAHSDMDGIVYDNLFANLDTSQPISISGYDVYRYCYSHRFDEGDQSSEFEIDDEKYTLWLKRLSRQEVRVTVHNLAGIELIGCNLYDLAGKITEFTNKGKDSLPPDKLTLDTENGPYRLRVIMQNVHITTGNVDDAGVDYEMMVMFGD
jgi:hypothetical protein